MNRGLPAALGAADNAYKLTGRLGRRQRLDIAVATFMTVATFSGPTVGTRVSCRHHSGNGVFIDHLIHCITEQDDVLVERLDLAL